jgi:hypothetical protein
VETETAVRVGAIGLPHLDGQVGGTSVANENQSRWSLAVRAVRHPAFFRHDLDVRYWREAHAINRLVLNEVKLISMGKY